MSKKKAAEPKYPSLHVVLEDTVLPSGKDGSTVRCTDSGKSLGFVWWEVGSGTTVRWHYRAPGAFGITTTERAAVDALRRLQSEPQLELDEAQSEIPARRQGGARESWRRRSELLVETEERPSEAPSRPAPPAPSAGPLWPSEAPSKPAPGPIKWADDTDTPFDVTAAIAESLRRRQ